VLSRRTLNRTLLQRQHLLARTTMSAPEMTEHLVGLQAQETLPPYLSLWSRVTDFDPLPLSDSLEDRTTLRLLLMRGTIHLVTAADALVLRPLVQSMLDRLARSSQTSRPAATVAREDLAAATRVALDGGPLPVKRLGELLAERFPGIPPGALSSAARELLPLVQVPPRGRWKQSGGVSYQLLETWLGTPAAESPDPGEAVRRYLRAFGPATPADVTTWSGVTGIRSVLTGLGDELRCYQDAAGTTLFDLEGLELADADVDAPVRLLGRYDNVWLSHAARDRVTPDPEKRRRWMGVNGGVGCTVFVDGELEGLWRTTASGAVDVELFRSLTRDERAQLDDQVGALESFLAR
jgi:hypothetical protein